MKVLGSRLDAIEGIVTSIALNLARDEPFFCFGQTTEVFALPFVGWTEILIPNRINLIRFLALGQDKAVNDFEVGGRVLFSVERVEGFLLGDVEAADDLLLSIINLRQNYLLLTLALYKSNCFLEHWKFVILIFSNVLLIRIHWRINLILLLPFIPVIIILWKTVWDLVAVILTSLILLS